MGKHDFLSPKAIGNRIKAKGLQKLRWYCQMCNKQCRDENGFKCHQMSDSHQRQMLVFGHNPDRVIDGYSELFQEAFLTHLRVAHRHARIAAHVVYNEYISDKEHIHMNATQWTSLTEFVTHLGKEGFCKVEDTPKGWFITLHVENPFQNIKDKDRLKRDRAEEEESERQARELQEQVERAHKAAKVEVVVATELRRDDPDEKIGFGLTSFSKLKAAEEAKGKAKAAALAAPVEGFGLDAEDRRAAKASTSAGAKGGHGGGALAEIMKEEKRKDEAKLQKLDRESRTDNWVAEGIVVKVMSKALQEMGHYKKKGTILKVKDKYLAVVKMIEAGTKIMVDQAELETVIPNIGGKVLLLQGAFRGLEATVVSVDIDNFSAKLEIAEGQYEGRKVTLPYEDISKLA